MTVNEIVKTWLKENGYDGLAGEECGCKLDALFPCDSLGDSCVAGHLVQCPCEKDCYLREDNEGAWCILPGKAEVKK